MLRNFFKLEYSERKRTELFWDTPADYFKGCGYWGDFTLEVDARRSEARRNRALATYSRTKNHMVKKGLIKTKSGKGPNTEGIALTAKGKKKAQKIYSNNN